MTKAFCLFRSLMSHEKLKREPTRQLRVSSYLLLVILAAHVLLLAYGAYCQSPTLDEPAHLVAGISHWKFGRFDLYQVNPPLVRMVAALPVLACDYTADWSRFIASGSSRPVFAIGEDFMAANCSKAQTLFVIARLACIPFSVLCGIICFCWARDVANSRAGLLAASLWCFSPSVIANAQLITPDAHATGIGTAACYLFWKWLRNPTWRNVATGGIVLGLAESAKTTFIIFYPLWFLIWLIYRWKEKRFFAVKTWRSEFPMLICRMAIGLVVVNIVYGFEGSFRSLGEFQFVSKLFSGDTNANGFGNRFVGTSLSELPVPFPANYINGMDIQQRDFESFRRPSYLRGVFQERGWWYYYFYVIAVKVPIGMLLLGALSLSRLLNLKSNSLDMFVIAAIPFAIFVVVSSKTGFSHHGRYILPCYSFTFVYIAVAICKPAGGWLYRRIVAGGITWSITSLLVIYPHSIAYFNEFTGGPFGGPKHLLSSNIDWGQDLGYLQEFLDAEPPNSTVALAYYGGFDPKGFCSYDTADDTTDVDAIAISVNLLYTYPVDTHGGQPKPLYHFMESSFRTFEYSIHYAGYSIIVFERKKSTQDWRRRN